MPLHCFFVCVGSLRGQPRACAAPPAFAAPAFGAARRPARARLWDVRLLRRLFLFSEQFARHRQVMKRPVFNMQDASFFKILFRHRGVSEYALYDRVSAELGNGNDLGNRNRSA